MEDSYQLGPLAISKSFVQNPLFLPGVFIVAIFLALIILTKGNISFLTPAPTLKAQIFPLNQQLSKSIVYSVGTTIFRTNGQSEEKLFEVGSEVLSLVPNNDGSYLAATYKHPSGGVNSNGYPYSSLIFWDMNTKRSLPVIAQERTTVRYPQWSEDRRYLSFWVNDGEESFVYDMTRRRAIFSVKREGSSLVSPIVFLPGVGGIVYVKNNSLYSSATDGSRPIILTEQVDSAPSSLVPSVNGINVTYRALNGDLKVINTTTRETKVVDSNAINLGFINNDELVYTRNNVDTKKTAAFFRFSITNAKSVRINNGKGFLALGTVTLPVSSQMYLSSVYPNLGPKLLSKDGTIEKDCSMSDFHYEYNSNNDTRFPQSLQVVSSDGKYLLGTSNNSQAILDVATCQPYIITQSNPKVMTWMP